MEKSVFTDGYSAFLQILVDTRKSAGIRQVDLAKSLGTTQSFVSKIERGELRVDVIQLRAICLALNTTLGEFVVKLEDRLEETTDRKKSGRR